MKKATMKPVAKAAGPAKATASKAATKSSPNLYADEDKKYKVEDAMRTLMRAEELKKDKALMNDVGKLAKEQAQKLAGLCGKAK
jgi:hypothetical protein